MEASSFQAAALSADAVRGMQGSFFAFLPKRLPLEIRHGHTHQNVKN